VGVGSLERRFLCCLGFFLFTWDSADAEWERELPDAGFFVVVVFEGMVMVSLGEGKGRSAAGRFPLVELAIEVMRACCE